MLSGCSQLQPKPAPAINPVCTQECNAKNYNIDVSFVKYITLLP
jgi:hypothetical protein